MGSGDKFSVFRTGGLGFGVVFARFPHTFSVTILFLFWSIYLGFGKGYDE